MSFSLRKKQHTMHNKDLKFNLVENYLVRVYGKRMAFNHRKSKKVLRISKELESIIPFRIPLEW